MRAFWATLAVACAAAVCLQAAGPVKFTDVKLKNGLRVIVAADHTAPTVAIAVTYNVGSADEHARRTGFAHLFEHMMFKGSQNVGPGEHPALIFNNGGTMNGTTDEDRTMYFEVLPSNQLELALFLEGDRMKSLDITKANLDNQRNAVQEERRLRVDNQPYGETFEAHVGAGLRQLRIQALDDRFDGRSQRCHGGRCGDVLQDVLRAEQRRALDRRRRGPEEHDGARAEVLRRDRIAAPAKAAEPDGAAAHGRAPQHDRGSAGAVGAGRHRLDCAAVRRRGRRRARCPLRRAVGGRSGRLNEVLVRQKQIATSAGAGNDDTRGPGLFQAFATVAPGKDAAEVESAIYTEIDKIKAGQIEDWELDKARNSARRNAAAAETSTLQRAIQLGEYALFYNDPNLINTRVDRIVKVTGADVQRVAQKYFTKEIDPSLSPCRRRRRREVSSDASNSVRPGGGRRSHAVRFGAATAAGAEPVGRSRHNLQESRARFP